MKAVEIEVRAKVVELDMALRTAALRGAKGKIVTVDVPADVKNFDQVRVGDDLVVRYLAALAAQLEPASRTGISARVEPSEAGPAGAARYGRGTHGRAAEGLQTVDCEAGTATLHGVERTVTLELPEGIDIAKLKVGDEVRAVFVEPAVISVERPRCQAGAARRSPCCVEIAT